MARPHSVNNQQGYILLFSVLIVSAIATAIATSALLSGLADGNTASSYEQEAAARAAADACAEEALNQIAANLTYVGSGALSLANSSCSYSITATGTLSKAINATGLSNNVTRRVQVVVPTYGSRLTPTSWQEISAF